MKKFIIVLLCFMSVLLLSCTGGVNPQDTAAISDNYGIYSSQIKELESKLLELQQSQYISDAEGQKKIKELENQISVLKGKAAESSNATESATIGGHFLYKVENGYAVITGFTGSDTELVIPCAIDGFEVASIAEEAFASSDVKSIIITDGIKEIGWFAFYSCKSLTAVTIPSSVTKIGYSSFEGCAVGFTVYCHNDSFAKAYAVSYGIAYALI